jgi:hypothetical protein
LGANVAVKERLSSKRLSQYFETWPALGRRGFEAAVERAPRQDGARAPEAQK